VTSPLRVLMTADAVGGVWSYALDLAAGLATQAETTLVVLGPAPSPDQRLQAQAVEGLTLIETGLPLDWMATELAEIREAGAAVRGLARRIGAEVIHLNSPALAADGGFCAPVLGACHSCLATWWSAVKDGPMPPDFRWRTQALWRGMLACSALVAPSRSFARATARTYETPPPLVVHNGRSAPADLSTGKREPLVFASGRLWDEGKNVAVLDAAAGLGGAPLYAAGPLAGPGGANCLELKHAHGLGRLPAMAIEEWLSRAAVYATGALYEPFGLGVLEAAQAGCALVLSDIPTFRELWNGAAVFVDARDPAGFARAFEALLTDEAEASRLGALARARARRFSVRAMSDGVRAIYRNMRARAGGGLNERAVA
jgi:glycogen synthase